MAGNLPVTLTTFETELQAKINTVGGGTSIEDIISYYRAGENIPTINNTALTAEVQSRLNAVSSSTTAEEFLTLAASFGKVSNTNQNDLQSALLAIEDIPTNSELANALSPIATSTELTPLAKSSELVPLATKDDLNNLSKSTPLGGLVFINSMPEIFEESGATFLKTGRVVEAGNLYNEVGGRFYIGIKEALFNTVVGEENTTKICATPDGSIYTADTTDNYISKYDENGNQITRINHSYGALGDILYLQGYLLVTQSGSQTVRVYDLDLNFVKNILLISENHQAATVVGNSLYYLNQSRITGISGVDVATGAYEKYLGQTTITLEGYSLNSLTGGEYNPSTKTILLSGALQNTDTSVSDNGIMEISVTEDSVDGEATSLVEWDTGTIRYGMSILDGNMYTCTWSTSWSTIQKYPSAVGLLSPVKEGFNYKYMRIK